MITLGGLVGLREFLRPAASHLMCAIGLFELWLLTAAAVDDMRAAGVELASRQLICR